MHVVDEAGRAAAGVRIITDNGIFCFTLLDGTASWRNSRSCGEPFGSRCVTITTVRQCLRGAAIRKRRARHCDGAPHSGHALVMTTCHENGQKGEPEQLAEGH
jgi:hypothetical protein